MPKIRVGLQIEETSPLVRKLIGSGIGESKWDGDDPDDIVKVTYTESASNIQEINPDIYYNIPSITTAKQGDTLFSDDGRLFVYDEAGSRWFLWYTFDNSSVKIHTNNTLKGEGTLDDPLTVNAVVVALKGDLNPLLEGTDNGDGTYTFTSKDGNNAFTITIPILSVNGQTGNVTLDADDIDDSATVNKFVVQQEKDEIARIDEHFADTTSRAINVKYPPSTLTAALGDGQTDDTVAIQAIIDYQYNLGGGIVFMPTGSYVIEGTITMKENVVLTGAAQFNPYSLLGVSQGTTIILHEPNIAATDLFIAKIPDASYTHGMGIYNLNIQGNANSKYAINFNKVSCTIKNVCINGGSFVDGIVCESWIHSRVSGCLITAVSNAAIRITGGVCTTTVFERCYLRESAWAFIAEAGTCTGISLNDCIFESCHEGGLDIHVDNNIDINNPYTENIPIAQSAKTIVQIGVNGTPINPTYPFGSTTINGGTLGGINGSIDAGSSVISVDKVAALSITGTVGKRAGYFIKTTSDTKLVTLLGISMVSVTSATGGIADMSKVIILGYRENQTARNELNIPKINFTGRNKWNIRESYSQTDGDLVFTLNSSIFPLWLDASGNIRHHYAGSPGAAQNVDMYGPQALPSFGALAIFAEWAQTIDGVVLKRQWDSSNNYYTMGVLAKTTANRPTTGNFIGREVFDTTLNKPIWRNATNNGWVEVASSAQGSLADTAIQPGDNVSGLTNDAAYLDESSHDALPADNPHNVNIQQTYDEGSPASTSTPDSVLTTEAGVVKTTPILNYNVFNQNIRNSVSVVGTTETTILSPTTGSLSLTTNDCAANYSYELEITGELTWGGTTTGVNIILYVGSQAETISIPLSSIGTEPIKVEAKLDFLDGIDTARTCVFTGNVIHIDHTGATVYIPIPETELTVDVSAGTTLDATFTGTDAIDEITVSKAMLNRLTYNVLT